MSLRLDSFLVVAAVLALLATLPSCDTETQSCTMLGCADGFRVDFQRDGVWPGALYTVEVDLDGAKTTCTVTLPFASCDVAAACTGGDTAAVQLGQSGCALDPLEHKLSGVTILGKEPKAVNVTVSRAGASVGQDSYTPVFSTSQPNGADCEPTCRTAPPVTLVVK